MRVKAVALIGGVADVIGRAGAVAGHQHVSHGIATQQCSEEVGLVRGCTGKSGGQCGGPVLVVAGPRLGGVIGEQRVIGHYGAVEDAQGAPLCLSKLVTPVLVQRGAACFAWCCEVECEEGARVGDINGTCDGAGCFWRQDQGRRCRPSCLICAIRSGGDAARGSIRTGMPKMRRLRSMWPEGSVMGCSPHRRRAAAKARSCIRG